MAALGLTAEPGALLLAAYLYYFGGGAALAAFFTAALAHELGHLLAIALTGARVRGFSLTAAGPVIRYGGCLTRSREAAIAAAGPLSGVAFGVLCLFLDTSYFRYAGAVAFLSSAFNLLPAYPMDGGRLARLWLEAVMPESAARAVTRALGCLTGAGIGAQGIVWRSPVMVAAGILLLANAVRMG